MEVLKEQEQKIKFKLEFDAHGSKQTSFTYGEYTKYLANIGIPADSVGKVTGEVWRKCKEGIETDERVEFAAFCDAYIAKMWELLEREKNTILKIEISYKELRKSQEQLDEEQKKFGRMLVHN